MNSKLSYYSPFFRDPRFDARIPSVTLSVYHDRIVTLHSVEVSIHTILFVRRLYPVDLFTRKKKWDAPVYQSRHPALNEYISGAVKAVGEELSLVMLHRSCTNEI